MRPSSARAPRVDRPGDGRVGAGRRSCCPTSARCGRLWRNRISRPASRRTSWLPRFGNSVATAIVHFSIRTLLRSRQHRVMLAFYLGIGFAHCDPVHASSRSTPAIDLSRKPRSAYRNPADAVLHSGGNADCVRDAVRSQANWIFRVTPLPGTQETSERDSAVAAGSFPWPQSGRHRPWRSCPSWPWRIAAGHLIALGFLE